MFLTHRFGSTETLDRARYWLTRHGFEVTRPNGPEHDEARLAMNLGLSEVSAALALIDSIERSDPEGWPGLLDLPKSLHSHAAKSRSTEDLGPTSTPIHWQSRADRPSGDPYCVKTCEYMLSRWE